MAKEKKRYCGICGEEISVPMGLLYRDSYCCNCGTIIRTRRTLFGKEIYHSYAKDGTHIIIEMRGGEKKNGKCKMPKMR